MQVSIIGGHNGVKIKVSINEVALLLYQDLTIICPNTSKMDLATEMNDVSG